MLRAILSRGLILVSYRKMMFEMDWNEMSDERSTRDLEKGEIRRRER